jgi:hypothetical protein
MNRLHIIGYIVIEKLIGAAPGFFIPEEQRNLHMGQIFKIKKVTYMSYMYLYLMHYNQLPGMVMTS